MEITKTKTKVIECLKQEISHHSYNNNGIAVFDNLSIKYYSQQKKKCISI